MIKLISIIIFAVTLFAQVEVDKPKFPYSLTPDFFIDAVPFKSADSGKTRIDFFIQVPYDNLQFTKIGEKYAANYSANLTVYDKDEENILSNQQWDQNVTVEDFSSTASKNSFSLNLKSFDLYPNDYFIRCQLTDEESGKSFSYKNKFKVPQLSDTLSLSGIVLIQKKVQDSQGRTRILPNVSGNVSSQMKILPFLFEINSDKTRRILLRYVIKNRDDEEVFSKEYITNIDSGKNSITQEVENLDVSLGQFKLVIEAKNENNQLISVVDKTFRSRIFGFPKTIEDLELAVDQMVYIASNEEIDNIQDVETFEEKMKLFIDFWDKKDPSPNTVENEILNEYYRRIEYANQHFGNYFQGWKSDMGMVYVTLGPPNSVERHPFEYDSKPYERWDYYTINKSFVFVDYTGFGDYRLLNPDYREWMRYRP